MSKNHIVNYLAEYNKAELDKDFFQQVQDHLSVCISCRKALEDIQSLEKIVTATKSTRVTQSPFLMTRISASLAGTKISMKEGFFNRKFDRVLVSVISVLVVVSALFLFLPATNYNSDASGVVAINIEEIQDYALENPDLLMAFSSEPTTYNSTQILEALYSYSIENDWGSDPEKLYSYYRFIISNTEEFI